MNHTTGRGDKLIRESIPFKHFDIRDKGFINFCSGYFLKRHGPLVMPEERLKTILNHGLITDIVSYNMDNRPAAYIFEVSDEDMTHFWYSFYDLSLIYQSLGMWLGEQNSDSHHLSGSRFAYMLGARSDAYFMYVSDK